MALRLPALATSVLACTCSALALDTSFREQLSRPAPPVLDAMPQMPTDVFGNPITNLTVFVLPHSHDDTGWQRTVDQYYVEQVRYIYDSVVSELRKNSRRKFIFVETAYFMRWWREQSEDVREATKQLHRNGQIEWVNGGWCMADDASPSADGQVDQNALGHRYIQDIFGVQVQRTVPAQPALDTEQPVASCTQRGGGSSLTLCVCCWCPAQVRVAHRSLWPQQQL